MDIATVLAIIPLYLGLILSGVIFVRQERELKRTNQWQRELQQQQHQNELILNQPSIAVIGSELAIHRDVVPQWLDAAAAQQVVRIRNRGKSTPLDVQAVLFPRASNLPAGSPPQTRTDELLGTYWHGVLDDGPEPGQETRLVLTSLRFPLTGDLSLIPGRTLFAPPEPNAGTSPGAHYYFGRLTLTFRDVFGRLLVCDFDGESVPHENRLTQTWRPGAGPTVVQHDLRMLTDEAASARWPPSIG